MHEIYYLVNEKLTFYVYMNVKTFGNYLPQGVRDLWVWNLFNLNFRDCIETV